MEEKSFIAFLKKCFEELNCTEEYLHNWHIDEIAKNLMEVLAGKTKRLTISMPPRYLKSICISIGFVAFCLGNDPSKKFIVASYSKEIAHKLSLETKRIMQSEWFLNLFPNCRLSKFQCSKQKLLTTQNGFRYAVSIGGAITGEGADILIVDDPHKPIDVLSKKKRNFVCEWFQNTFLSRLNNKKNGKIIIVMQRLHKEDLVGVLKKKNDKKWKFLILKAISNQDEQFREQNQAIHPDRESISDLEELKKSLGEETFESQYQQNPANCDFSFIQKQNIQTFELENTFINIKQNETDEIFFSLDTAYKTGRNNDESAICIWKVSNGKFYVIDIFVKKMEFIELESKTMQLESKYKPTAILIEDKASGSSLLQVLRSKYTHIHFLPFKPKASKIARFYSSLFYFESQRVFFNSLSENFEKIIFQLTNFPNIEHDDIVDSITSFLNWYREDWQEIKHRFTSQNQSKMKIRTL